MKPLPDEAIEEYKAIYRKEVGKDLSDADAREQGEGLIRLIFNLAKMPYTPVKTKDNDEELRLAWEWKRRTIGPRDPRAFIFDLIERFQECDITPSILKPEFPLPVQPFNRGASLVGVRAKML